MKPGKSILRKYGLFEELEKIGLLRMERLEYWDHGQKVKTILPDQNVGHVGIHVPQNHLLGLLLEKSKPLSDYRLLLNTKVTGLLEDDERYLGVKAIQNGKEVKIKSTLIVGADGRFSMVRKLAQFPVTKIHHGYDLLWARIPAPPNWEPTIRNAIVDDQQLAIFTQQGGFIQIGWNIPEGSYSEIRKGSFAPFLQKLIDAFPELEATVRENIQSWQDFILLQVQSSKSADLGQKQSSDDWGCSPYDEPNWSLWIEQLDERCRSPFSNDHEHRVIRADWFRRVKAV